MRMRKALIVVDMLNDFINSEGALFCGPTAQQIIPFVKARVDEYRATGYPVIFLGDAHAEDDLEFKRFPKHCVEGTHGAKIIPELCFTKGLDAFVTKTRYSGFYDTNLYLVMGVHFNLAPLDTVVEVAGVCTSICVMDTIGDLSNQDYATVIHRNCVADFDQEMHDMAIKRMSSLYGTEII
jgi:nicotinamidase-related amidase